MSQKLEEKFLYYNITYILLVQLEYLIDLKSCNRRID
jgi:hypothetical protein